MSEPSSIMKRVRSALPWALLVVGVFWFSNGFRPAATYEVGNHLPELSAQLLDGTLVDLSAAPGQPMVVNFWASYCGPCRAEAPMLSDLHRRGVRVIGLSVDARSTAQLTSAAHDFGIVYPVGLGGTLVAPMSIHTIPTTYVLSPRGTILLSRVGLVSRHELDEALAVARQ